MSIDGKSEVSITITAIRENEKLLRVNRQLRSALVDNKIPVPVDCETDPVINQLKALTKRNAELGALVNYWRAKAEAKPNGER